MKQVIKQIAQPLFFVPPLSFLFSAEK